ncbi:MAG: HAD family hydrolase [Flavobacteriaceae bacterium]|nr:HAD family hydrolase [Flavobacteriaceae bacterium]|tara:strand:+ start:4070 stop:4684 length:615 start_codon:yes stop_codon:yes gene_type:complete
MNTYKNIIFDLGGVLIDWNPEYVYLKEFNNDKKEMKWFFDNICTFDWNENQDAGYPLKKATEERVKLFPQYENLIRIYYGRWEEMLGGPIERSVSILRRIKKKNKLNVFALTNWSAETFPTALKKFDFLSLFEGIIVSGEEKTRKPFEKIYQITIDRFKIDPTESVFIDDNLRNVKAAEKLNIKGIHFKNPDKLEIELRNLKIL